MKKWFSLICLTTLSVTVQADWKATVEDGWSGVKSTSSALYADIIGDDRADKSLSGLPAPRQKAITSWDKVEDRFSDIIEVKEDQSLAPESALFKKEKAAYQEDINELLQDVYSILNDQIIKEASDHIVEIDSAILDIQEKISEQKSKSVISIGKEQSEAIVKQEAYQEQLDEYQIKRQHTIETVQSRLAEFDTVLSIEQVEALLVRVNADDILAMTTIFPVISEIASSFAKITATSGEDLNHAKKYYSMYVVLLELQLYIQDVYITDLKEKYIPRINGLQAKQNNLIESTKKELRNASAKHKKLYSLNLKSQSTTLQAIKLYKVNMQDDLNNMIQAHSLLMKDYKLAVNTLNTVTMSSQVSSLINDSDQLFEKVMALQAPELVPFNNIQMQKEFSALTQKIK